MPRHPILYYITDRKAFTGDEPTRRRRLLEKISEAALAGIDYIQLREKDLSASELESLAKKLMSILGKLRAENRELRTALLINSRTDIALAANADGVHLRSDDVSPADLRKTWKTASLARNSQPSLPIIGVSCHSPADVEQAAASGAGFAVFAPVFEKKAEPGADPAGLQSLGEACRANLPVLALGGITLQNAGSCLDAGAAGIAAIRLFQENNIAEVVSRLRTK
jgi:thiamine-phosphate pyrophosphorylase